MPQRAGGVLSYGGSPIISEPLLNYKKAGCAVQARLSSITLRLSGWQRPRKE
jgi:hypothetical protein